MDYFPNIDIDRLLSDHKLSYQNAYENVTDQLKQIHNNRIKLYAQKMEENYKISSNTTNNFDIFLILYIFKFKFYYLEQLSDINTKMNEGRNKVKCTIEKIKSEQETLRAEHDRLESINNECSLLEIEENKLKDMIGTSKDQLTKVFKGMIY